METSTQRPPLAHLYSKSLSAASVEVTGGPPFPYQRSCVWADPLSRVQKPRFFFLSSPCDSTLLVFTENHRHRSMVLRPSCLLDCLGEGEKGDNICQEGLNAHMDREWECPVSGCLGLPRWLSGRRICLPAQQTQEMQVWSLGREDPLEEEMATPSSILAWEIPWTEEPGRLWSIGWQRVRHSCATKHTAHFAQCFYVWFDLHNSIVRQGGQLFLTEVTENS